MQVSKLKCKSIYLVIILWIFSLSLTFSQASISGKLLQSDDSLSIGAVVRLADTDYVAYTNALGKFRILGVSLGDYYLKIENDNGIAFEKEIKIGTEDCI